MLGMLPPLDVDSPWWPDAEPVVAAVRERHGIAVTILRVLRTTCRGPTGGEGSYLAETSGSVGTLSPVDDDLRALAEADDPLRQPWARPGGVALDISWAECRLAALGTPGTGRAEQVKTWNLSSVLRLTSTAGLAWCKRVPAFMAHEGPLLQLLARSDA